MCLKTSIHSPRASFTLKARLSISIPLTHTNGVELQSIKVLYTSQTDNACDHCNKNYFPGQLLSLYLASTHRRKKTNIIIFHLVLSNRCKIFLILLHISKLISPLLLISAAYSLILYIKKKQLL